MRVLVDMDGVLADFETGFLENWTTLYPDKPFIPLEERTLFYIAEQYPAEMKPLIYQIFSAPQFFRKIKPIKGGVTALREMERMGLEVFICTSPLREYRNCVLEKYEWIEEHLGSDWTKRIILTRDKTIVRGDFLIDDKPDIKGVDVPGWEHIIYDQPYNRSITNRRRITWDNWKPVLFPPETEPQINRDKRR